MQRNIRKHVKKIYKTMLKLLTFTIWYDILYIVVHTHQERMVKTMKPKDIKIKTFEIKAARIRLGYTQKKIADKLGMSEQTYQKKESGHARFSDSEKIALGKELGLTFAQLNSYLYDGIFDMFA